jgi:fructose-bisphosphate aldolase, class I
MGLGKKVRLNRLFSHPSGNLLSVAIDHFPIYQLGLPPGLRHIESTLDAIIRARPDAVTLHKGIALALMPRYAGQLPFIIQSSVVTPDDGAMVQVATAEDAVRLGADALAVVAYVHGKTEAAYLRTVADCVREGEKLEMPVICHVYPRDARNNIIYTPEDIAWAVRCILETGADVIKTPYCGDPLAHAQIVADCPVPMVCAGGPKTNTMREALSILREAVQAGVKGGTVGRNIWGSENIGGAVRAYKAIVHDCVAIDEALAYLEG